MFTKTKYLSDEIVEGLRIASKDLSNITQRMSHYRDAVVTQYEKRELIPCQNNVIERPLTLDYISKEISKDDAVKTKIEKLQFQTQKMKKVTKAKKL
jgi:hypothetical protein